MTRAPGPPLGSAASTRIRQVFGTHDFSLSDKDRENVVGACWRSPVYFLDEPFIETLSRCRYCTRVLGHRTFGCRRFTLVQKPRAKKDAPTSQGSLFGRPGGKSTGENAIMARVWGRLYWTRGLVPDPDCEWDRYKRLGDLRPYGSNFSLSAIRPSFGREAAFIFRIILRWTLTVTSLTPMSAAICLLRRPRTT